MSTPDGSVLSFLPWVRRGASSVIRQAEDVTKTTLSARPSFDVQTTVNAANPGTTTVRLYGPGDVTGLDPRQIVRVEPKPYSNDFEPNYLAAIEFDFPDLVWMMTPANPQAGAKLRPWICLVVVSRGPDVTVGPDPDAQVPVLAIAKDAAKQLPDLAESWAWAHAQVTGDVGGESLESVLESSPERTISRLVCPRRLEPGTAYVACVVPTTKAGVQAGLGDPVTTADLTPAWKAGDASVRLPVFHSWEFSTGPAGDFESLARLLQPGPPPEGAGQRDMDVSDAGIGANLTAGQPGSVLGFEGALRSPSTEPTPWPEPARSTFQAKLRELLDAPATLAAQDPSLPGVVAPPLYGGFHASRQTVPPERPRWLRELNLDPRYRAASGLGTQVVQEQQEELMESAWQQVGEIDRANDALRKAQLARAAAAEIHTARLERLDDGSLLQVTSAAHARLLMSPHTLEAQVRGSALPQAALSPAFRRIARPGGPLARRLNPGPRRLASPIVSRLNSGDVLAAAPRTAPDGSLPLTDVADTALPPWVALWLRPLLRALLWALPILALLLLVLGVLLGLLVSPVLFVVIGVAVVAGAAALRLRRELSTWVLLSELQPAALGERQVETTPPRPDWAPIGAEAPPGPSPQAPGAPASATDSDSAARFRVAARVKQAELQGVAESPAPGRGPALEFGELRTTLLERLDPRVTVPPVVLGRLDLPDGWEPEDPIQEIMAAPRFDAPMYEPLRDLGKDALMPGVGDIKQNTVTLLETNPHFIEAYMVGLSHEMGRELLWRGYPTDQRGTYFRHFWDPRGHVPAPVSDADREALADIPAIHAWQSRRHLGETEAAGKPEGLLVLLVCGQLLKRYPTTVIYASKASGRPGAKGRAPLDPPEEKYPLFRATLPPNVTLLGFDLSAASAKGGPAPKGGDPDPGPGWFFVFQQQHTEPRFGLDVHGPAQPGRWSDLNWDVAAVVDDHLSVAGTRTALSGAGSPLVGYFGADAGALAVQLLQTHYRVAISADDMLP